MKIKKGTLLFGIVLIISLFLITNVNAVGCTKNSDCGVSQQCDYTNLKLKTPQCISGECSYVTENVDCCSSQDCAVGYFCSTHECLESVPSKTSCPFECCENEQAYFDRPCQEGYMCNGSNRCINPLDEIRTTKDYTTSIIIGICIIIGFIILAIILKKSKIKSKEKIKK